MAYLVFALLSHPGTEFVVQSDGHLCRICNLFVGSREDALKHCKAYAHHISLVNVLAKVNQVYFPPSLIPSGHCHTTNSTDISLIFLVHTHVRLKDALLVGTTGVI